MNYTPSREAMDSLWHFGLKIASESKRDREARLKIKERETALLKDFRANGPKKPKQEKVWMSPEESRRIAENARDMFAAGKTKAQVCEALGVAYRILTYHLEKHGMKSAERDARFVVRHFELTEEVRQICDSLRPHTSWDDIAAKVGVNRSTLIKHYMRHTGAKRGGRCNARSALKKAA